MYLRVSLQQHAGVFGLDGEIGMHALPVVVEELVSETWLLVEEDHDAEIRLLIGTASQCKFREGIRVRIVIRARSSGLHDVGCARVTMLIVEERLHDAFLAVEISFYTQGKIVVGDKTPRIWPDEESATVKGEGRGNR